VDALDFIKDLDKLRKLLQQKLKKEINWIWTSSGTKIMQNIKKVCKNLLVVNLPNGKDDLILDIDANNEHGSAILKIKKGEKLCKYCNGSFNKAYNNYPMMEKETLIVIRIIEKILIFLAPKLFLI